MKKHNIQLIALFCIELIILLPFTLVNAFTINHNPNRDVEVGLNSATINWTTDELSDSTVRYGTDKEVSSLKKDSSMNEKHSVSLGSLQADTKYYYALESNDGSSTTVDDNSNSFYSFTTLGHDNRPQFIDVEIPRYINTKEIEIKGSVKPYSKVRLYIDGIIKGQIIGEQTGEQGIFDFGTKYIGESGTHTIRIWTQDPAGNEYEANFIVTIDLEKPILNVAEIPSVATNKTLIIRGRVNENSTINFYIILGEKDTTAPAKITGLTEEEVSENRISFFWDESVEEDFDKYLIYREDVGIIDTISSKKNSKFTDRLVNSGAEYSYRVAAMDKAGNIGIKSNPLTFITLTGGRTDVSIPHVVSIAKEPTRTLSVIGDFYESFKLDDDGTYQIKIEAIDVAGNVDKVETELLLDTEPPEIKIISPRDRTSIYEHYADDVDIEGVTEPNATVYLYVQRTPLGHLNASFDVHGLPDEILHLDEAKLSAGCSLVVGGTEYCGTNADYETRANSEGYFKFDNVALLSTLSLALISREVPVEELDRLGRESAFEEQRRTREASLLFIATDKVGKRGAEKVDYKIVTCWSGNLTWDIVPMLQWQSPAFLNPERIAEGAEHIYFYLNFTYLGEGVDYRISSVHVTPACEGYMSEDPRYNFSCKLIPNSCDVRSNDERTTWRVDCRLRALPELNTWTKKEWEGFFESIASATLGLHDIIFPFKIRIRYSHQVYGESGFDMYETGVPSEFETVLSSEYQTACIQVAYAVDNTKIDFRMLPDFLLYDTVDFLEDAINAINDVTEKLRVVLQWTGLGCVAAFALRTGVQIVRRISCALSNLKKFLEMVPGVPMTPQQISCEQCLADERVNYKDFGGNILKSIDQSQLSDECLKKCYPECSNMWDFEAKIYKLYRGLCDRVFCHSSPSRWTEDKGDGELTAKFQAGGICARDRTMRGQPLRVKKCLDVAKDYQIQPGTFDLDDKCFEIYSGNQKNLYTLGVNIQDNIYEITKVSGPSEVVTSYAIKSTENNYLTAEPSTCAEVCGLKIGQSQRPGEWVEEGYELIGAEEEQQIRERQQKTVEADLIRWECTTTSECRSWNQIISQRGQVLKKDDVTVEIKDIRAEPSGYTSDCFYNTIPALRRTVSENPNINEECCCIYANKGEENWNYYQPEDFLNEDWKEYEDMEWSYRYWKEGYLGKVYNPYRYIEGRDFTACFGRNNFFYDGFGTDKEDGKLLILDPFTQHTSAIQCLCISGIYNRLQMLNNIMTALRSCLLTVRTTGTADSGVCKELFSQYVCSAIWQIISYVTDGCTPLGSLTTESDEDNILDYVKTGLKGVWNSVEDSRRELMGEYGNVQLTNLLGIGEEALSRQICLAAFGYDWGFNMHDIVDAAYATPYATLVQAVLPSREYLAFNPFGGGRTNYEYRASWIINPGCEMDDYDVYLSCVTRNELDKYPGVNCDKQSDPEGINCDCLNLPSEVLKKFYNGRELSQNVLEDVDYNDYVEDFYRYDHLKFVLKPDRRIREDLKSKCFPYGHSDGVFYFPIKDKTGYDIVACYVDVNSGTFLCPEAQRFFGFKEGGYFVDVKINDQTASNNVVVHENEDLRLLATIFKSAEENLCLKMSVDNIERMGTIDVNGTHTYDYTLEQGVTLGGGEGFWSRFVSCDYKQGKEARNEQTGLGITCTKYREGSEISVGNVFRENERSVDFNIVFVDGPDEEGDYGKIDLSTNSSDRVAIVGRTPKVIGDLNKETDNIWWEDGKGGLPQGLYVEVENARFRIISIQGFDEYVESMTFAFHVDPYEGGVGYRIIRYGLYFLKSGESDCEVGYNPEERVEYRGQTQGGEYRIKVEATVRQAQRRNETG